jgi:hypothetical protein
MVSGAAWEERGHGQGGGPEESGRSEPNRNGPRTPGWRVREGRADDHGKGLV